MRAVECNAVDWIEAERILNDGQSLSLCKKEFSVYDMYVRQNFTLDDIEYAFEMYSENRARGVMAILEYNDNTVPFIMEWYDDAMPPPFPSRASYIVCTMNARNEICVQGDDLKETLTLFAAKVINAIYNKRI